MEWILWSKRKGGGKDNYKVCGFSNRVDDGVILRGRNLRILVGICFIWGICEIFKWRWVVGDWIYEF